MYVLFYSAGRLYGAYIVCSGLHTHSSTSLMCTHACAAHTSDEAAGGVLVDSGYVDNGAGLVGIPAETQEGMASGTQRGVLYHSSQPPAGSGDNNVHMHARLTYACPYVRMHSHSSHSSQCKKVWCSVVPQHRPKLLAYLKVLSDSS